MPSTPYVTTDALPQFTDPSAILAPGTTACVFTATAGPTGANTAIQGWAAFTIIDPVTNAAKVHYTPYW